MTSTSDRRTLPGTTVGPGIAIVLDRFPLAPWQDQCLTFLRRDLAARLRLAATLCVPVAAEGTSASQAALPPPASTKDGGLAGDPRLLAWRAIRGADRVLRPERAALTELARSGAELLIYLGADRLELGGSPTPPKQIWGVACGTPQTLWRCDDDLADQLPRTTTWASTFLVTLGPDGWPQCSLYAWTARLTPWAPGRSADRLLALVPRCLRAALRRGLDRAVVREGNGEERLRLPPLEEAAGQATMRRRGAAALSRARAAASSVRHELFYREHWTIGVIDAPFDAFLRGSTDAVPRWLPTPGRFTFLADPFHVVVAGESWLLAERFDHWKSKGTIAAARLAGTSEAEFRVILETAFHLSYPSVVATDEGVFLIPESWESGSTERFALAVVDRRLRVGPDHALLPGWRGVDPTIFRHDGSWWLFCGDQNDAPNEHLYLWFADRAEGPWHQHPWNPVVTDLRAARPAGPITMLDGALIRPAQDCSATYGGAVALMRIDRLTRGEYHESLVHRITPYRGSVFPDGLHTIGSLAGRTVIDGKRWIFSPLNPVLKLLAFLRNRRRRSRARLTLPVAT